MNQLESPADSQSQPAASAVPEGLYEPSRNQLSHALMQNGRFRVIPPDCPTDYVRPRSSPFVPQFFSTSEFALIRCLTEVLLGEPAHANDSVVDEVAEWIDLQAWSAKGIREAASQLLPEHRILIQAFFAGSANAPPDESQDPQRIYREGLQWISDQSKTRYGSPFENTPRSQQIELLQGIIDQQGKAGGNYTPQSFFKLIKAEVIRGFYTSQKGLREIDDKGNGFYARSPGCK
jgi:Gluconate 2-dehydrogenase subunit 3